MLVQETCALGILASASPPDAAVPRGSSCRSLGRSVGTFPRQEAIAQLVCSGSPRAGRVGAPRRPEGTQREGERPSEIDFPFLCPPARGQRAAPQTTSSPITVMHVTPSSLVCYCMCPDAVQHRILRQNKRFCWLSKFTPHSRPLLLYRRAESRVTRQPSLSSGRHLHSKAHLGSFRNSCRRLPAETQTFRSQCTCLMAIVRQQHLIARGLGRP